MKKEKIIKANLFFISLLLICLDIYSQEITQTIRGRIVDQESKIPLIGANIILIGTSPIIGGTTDINGYYELKNVPIGRWSIKYSYVGYEEVIIPQTLINSAQEKIINIELIESLTQLEEVVVKPEYNRDKPINDMALIGARSISMVESNKFAATGDDPSRIVKNFAGVAGTGDDIMNEFVIRGNSPNSMMWRVEGVEVFNPNHISDEETNGGAVNIISSNVMGNSDFFTGAWPSEYGNALSGIYDIKLRNGNNQTHEFAGQLSNFGIDFSSEGPILRNNNSSYIINYRYSVLTILQKMGIDITGDDVKTMYQDLSFKINYPAKKTGTLSLWGTGGYSKIYRDVVIGFYQQTNKYTHFKNGRNWDVFTGAMGINHKYLLKKQGSLSTSIAVSGKKEDEEIIEELLGSLVRDTSLFGTAFQEKFRKGIIQFSMEYKKKFNPKITFKSGIRIKDNLYNHKKDWWNTPIKKLENYLDGKNNFILFQAYAEMKYRILENLTFMPGMYNSYSYLNKSNSFEPRLSLQWRFTPKQSVSVGYGKHSILQKPYVLAMDFNRYNLGSHSNSNLDYTKANHYLISYELKPWANFRIKTELYFQDIYNVPIVNHNYVASVSDTNYAKALMAFSTLSSRVDGAQIEITDYIPLENGGTGKNYGIEFTIEKFLSQDWYFLTTLSLYESKYTGLDNIERNTRYNGNYNYNILVGKEFVFHRNQRIGFNLKYTELGGQRYTQLRHEIKILDINENELSNPINWETRWYAEDSETKNKNQYPAYKRFDLGLNYTINTSKVTHIICFEAQNLFGHNNIYRAVDNFAAGDLIFEYQNSFIPIIKYRIEF